jgi:predicted  nucleic acid-binding Zn-ribbon protein
MKKLLTLAISILVCACGLSRTAQADTREIRERVIALRNQLGELEKLRNGFKSRRITKDAYLDEAPRALSQFKADLDKLSKQITSYLDDLEGEQRAQFEPALENSVHQIENAVSEISRKFKEGKQTEDINIFAKSVSPALESIDGTLDAAAANARQRGGQSLPRAGAPSPSQGQEQRETSDIAYESYLLALLLLIAGGAVTWWLHNRLAELERALSKQNRDTPQLRQQLDEQLDMMWRELSTLQQQGADAQQQSHAQLLAEIERLRAAAQPARMQPSGAEPRIVRRRVEEPAEYTPSAAVATTPRLASAADYLRRAAGNGIRAKAAMLRPDVLQPAEGDGPYLLLPADDLPNCYHVIPAVPRFQSAQDYSHFSHFYDCDQPSSGEVFIVQPARAVYDHAADQWKLRSKGRLQIS